MGCSISREIKRRVMVNVGTVVIHKYVGTESSKMSTFDLQQTKTLKAVHLQIDSTTALVYLVKMGGTGNQILLKLKQINLAVSLETPDNSYCRIPSNFFEC